MAALAAAGCGGRSIGPESDAGARPEAALDLGVDRAPDALSEDARDAGIDAAWPCGCPPGQAILNDHCAPTTALGCVDLCVPGDTDCGPGRECSPCAAYLHCTEACQPACAQVGPATTGPVPEPLRISPTVGTAGVEADIQVTGHRWYVGALTYGVRVGEVDVTGSMRGAGECGLTVRAPAMAPGMVPVWVSQYGPSEPWVLAGFYTYSAGAIPTCIQPGFPCRPDDECCATAAVPVACRDGRCSR